MADRYASLAQTRAGRVVIRRLGLPDPSKLHRYRLGDPLVTGPVLLGAAPDGRARDGVAKLLAAAGVELAEPGRRPEPNRPPLYAGLVYDATGIADVAGLRALYDFFHSYLGSLHPGGRVVLLGGDPAMAGGIPAATAQRALEGFVRSLARELRGGATGQLVQVAPGAEGNLESTLRFLLSARSAYVSGQVLSIQPAPVAVPADWDRPLAGKVALVTGAAGGIGAATAQVLARDGAQLVCLDLASSGDALAGVSDQVGGAALQLDLTSVDAPHRLAEYVAARFGRLDILAHVAGISRRQTLPRMDPAGWDAVLDLNLAAMARITEALLAADLVPDGGRVVGISSVSAFVGNSGQTNYSASKAGLIGLCQALAAELAGQGITANAVAPGFIATPMTARMSLVQREVAGRINTLAQAGRPVDVAETIGWLAWPGSGGVTGQVVRVCGQSLLGA